MCVLKANFMSALHLNIERLVIIADHIANIIYLKVDVVHMFRNQLFYCFACVGYTF